LPNETILRAELRRLFRWLRERGVTVVLTGEAGTETLTRHGLEEYVTDAVVHLDHRVHDQISTRRIRIVKFRGSHHGTNEYPFLIDESGLSVLPVTSLALEHDVSAERISTGVEKLDAMLDGQGYFRGSTVLISGTAGTGKTTFAAHFAEAACRRGERCHYFLFEESPQQMMRNMKSAGVDLAPWVAKGLLKFHADRPSRFGLETHLLVMQREIDEFKPSVVIIDPVTNLMNVGTDVDVRSMLTRMIDYLKVHQITALFTSLTSPGAELAVSEVMISSLIDTWVVTTAELADRRRRRWVYVLKSRGMAHSDASTEFRFTSRGIEISAVDGTGS
jgi:circadian clock protein KaiC